MIAAAAAAACSAPNSDHAIQPLSLDSAIGRGQLNPLARAIGDRRIVLLGENGHGVGEFTSLKVELVRWLHTELGFEVVVMESGMFECGHVWDRLPELSARDALYQCLRYPFQHAQILPLFEFIRIGKGGQHPLELAGMDPQAQGFDSEVRPSVLADAVAEVAPGFGARIAATDSLLFLPESRGGLGDRVYPWILEHGEEARALYDSAAGAAQGLDRWTFALATGWIDRLTARAEAEAAGAIERPAAYYQLRDEWMARAVAALADSLAGPRKVVVWLHNDHARYGTFRAGANEVRSVGSFLRDWYPRGVFSVGLFLGRGMVADNSRRERPVATPASTGIEAFLARGGYEASYVILRGNRDPGVRQWADSLRPYLRLGIDSTAMVPADEFDALFYVHSVGPPDYEIP